MDNNTLRALRVIVNESTTKHIKELQKDSDELKKLKEELPILFLSDKDIDNHQTGKFDLEFYDDDGRWTDTDQLLFQGKREDKYLFKGAIFTTPQFTLQEIFNKPFFFRPCPKYGCDGGDCLFGDEDCLRCGLHFLEHGCHYGESDIESDIEPDEDGVYDIGECGFDLRWKRKPSNKDDGVLKEVQCKRCGKVLEEAEIIDHIYDYKNPIWKCPHAH